MKQYVPREFIMVYAPRDRTELEVVCRIIEAAGFWASGQNFELTLDEEPLPQPTTEPLPFDHTLPADGPCESEACAVSL